MLGENDFDVWEYLFPFDLIAEGETIPQIKSLLVSLISQCDAEFICKLFKLFPNVTRFRHLVTRNIEGMEYLHVCEHDTNIAKFQSVKLLKIGYQAHYNECSCFIELRKNMNLRRKDFCFWGDANEREVPIMYDDWFV